MNATEKEARSRAGEAGGGIRAEAADSGALDADLRLSALMRSLAQITPAVAHDLRAPINAMVFNLEILKETIASGKGSEPGGTERQLRYVGVLKEELSRLHRELEIFIDHISPRGDRTETVDLRELIEELIVLLTGPARKQQVQLRPELPDAPIPAEVNRYQLRQALLHLSLAALAGLGKDEELQIRLERRKDRALLRVAGAASPPGLDGGSEAAARARVQVARGLVASQGGEVRAAEEPLAYEIELTLAKAKE